MLADTLGKLLPKKTWRMGGTNWLDKERNEEDSVKNENDKIVDELTSLFDVIPGLNNMKQVTLKNSWTLIPTLKVVKL